MRIESKINANSNGLSIRIYRLPVYYYVSSHLSQIARKRSKGFTFFELRVFQFHPFFVSSTGLLLSLFLYVNEIVPRTRFISFSPSNLMT